MGKAGPKKGSGGAPSKLQKQASAKGQRKLGFAPRNNPEIIATDESDTDTIAPVRQERESPRHPQNTYPAQNFSQASSSAAQSGTSSTSSVIPSVHRTTGVAGDIMHQKSATKKAKRGYARLKKNPPSIAGGREGDHGHRYVGEPRER